MKTNTVARDVTMHTAESSTFTISNNAKIFKILIDGLYTNKIQSITREIWSNALDSHVEAGCSDRPFAVSLPSIFDPTFRVRDFGTGLSHDKIMNLYTDLGNSTKENTNSAIGKFGIGSKSPFAYTDNFTVTVVFERENPGMDALDDMYAYYDTEEHVVLEKRYYSAMIGSDGVPGIHLMGVEETTEEKGLEVAFPVHNQDTRAFVAAARRVSYGFDVKPEVINDENFAGWPEMSFTAEGDGWKLLSKELDGHRQQAYARMGPVLYPIDVNALQEPSQKVRDILKGSFVIDFAMGDLEITASREDLSYGRREPTGDAIKARAAEIYDEIVEKFQESYEACDTHFEACCKFREDLESDAIPASILNLIRGNSYWQGEPLNTVLKVKSAARWGLDICVLTSKLRNQVYRFNAQTDVDIAARRGTIVFVEDMRATPKPKRVATRLKEYRVQNANNVNQIVWVRGESKLAETSFMRLLDQLDGVTFLSPDDLPEIPKAVRTSGGSGYRSPVMARKLGRYDSKFSQKTHISPDEFESGGIYLPLERMVPRDWPCSDNPHRVLAVMQDLNLIDQPVYGAPKSMWKRFEGARWVNFYDHVMEVLDGLDVDFAIEKEADLAENAANNSIIGFMHDMLDEGAVCGEASPLFAEAAEFYMDAHRVENVDMGDYRRLFGYMKVDIVEGDVKRNWSEEAERMEERATTTYPLIGFIQRHGRWENNIVDIVRDYVILCDTTQQNHDMAIAAE